MLSSYSPRTTKNLINAMESAKIGDENKENMKDKVGAWIYY